MNCDKVINILEIAIGAIGALMGGVYVYRQEGKKQERHAASILYYDLKSIEDYLRSEKGTINIRYSEDWQMMTSSCTFLADYYVKKIYEIYDLVYNYNYQYKLKEQEGKVKKENIVEYKRLQNLFLENSKEHAVLKKRNKDYQKLLTVLEEHKS